MTLTDLKSLKITSEIKSPLLSLIVIRSADIDAAVVFYSALGLIFFREQHGTGPAHYSSVMNKMVFEIYPATRNGDVDSLGKNSTLIGFSVESLEAVLASLAKIGIAIGSTPKASEWGRWIKTTDPDGRLVRITEILS